MDERTAALLALAGASEMLKVIASVRADRKMAKRRIKEATARVPAAQAVKDVIEAASM